MKKIHLLTLIFVLFIFSCEQNPNIVGLWVVKSVTVGEEEMTPNARWMRFNSDFTQQSGNGWLQHSIGTWKLDPSDHSLTIINTNGLIDHYDPFIVTLSNTEMVWKRMEEGDSVEVQLERADQLPATFSDKLLGLWKLKKAVGNGLYFPESGETNDYLFFRWDKRFVIGKDNWKVNGVYNIHGHKPEVELIPYGEKFERNFWSIQFNENDITLRMLNTDSLVTRTFKRIYEFPQ